MAKPKPKGPTRRRLKAEAAMGKTKYVLLRGVVGWGLPALLFYLAVLILLNMAFYRRSLAEVATDIFPGMIILAAVIFGTVGVFMGRFRWKQLQRHLGKSGNKKG